MKRTCCRYFILALSLSILLSPASTFAQDRYPTRPIRLVVPSSPGGGTDTTARIVGAKLSRVLGQQVVVDNRPGAATMVGTEVVADSAPDGYTLLLANSSITIVPSMRKNPRMKVIRGVTPITLVSTNPQILVSHPSFPAKNVKELVAFAKAHPGVLNYAAGSYGGNIHLCMALFVHMTGTDMVFVPYKSGNAGLVDVVSGQIPLMMASILSALPHVRTGKLRAYGVTSAERSQGAPDVPTIAEAGVPGYEANQWFGVLAPVGTPAPIIAKLYDGLVTVLKDPDIRKHFTFDGSKAVWSKSPEDFGKFMRAEEAKWAQVVRDAKLEPR